MTATRLQLPAPAKLNLFLFITGRRADGYHELQTLFQFLDHGDLLTFQGADDLILNADLPDVAPGDNLVLRAARALQDASGTRQGATITLDKRLPMGGGIGGGSSDAATTLLGLNQLWQTGLGLDDLAEIGLALGADVPVFVRGHAALAEGVGERLTPVTPTEYWYLVLRPAVHIATPAVFSHPDLIRDTPPRSLAQLAALDPGQWHNDCESVVLYNYPEVEMAFRWLIKFSPARLTGTGSCLFGVFETEQEARHVLAQSPPELSGFVAKGCNLSPLHQALATYSASVGHS